MGINTRDSTQRIAPFAFFVGAGALLLSVLLARLVEVQLVNGRGHHRAPSKPQGRDRGAYVGPGDDLPTKGVPVGV